MSVEKQLEVIVGELEAQKGIFLSSLETKIQNCIKSKSTSTCLTIVLKKNSEVKETWRPQQGIPYIQRLIAFLRNKNFAGFEVDSILTDEITNIAVEEFNLLYSKNDELISREFTIAMMENPAIRKALLSALGETKPLRYTSSEIKTQVFNMLVDSITSNAHDIAQTLTAKTTGVAIVSSTAFAITKAIVVKIAMMFSVQIKILLLKLIAIPAVKKVIILLVKKFIILAIAGSLIKLIVAKTGLSIGAVVAIVLAPIIALLLKHEWSVFPEKLSKEVSKGVRKELSGEFRKTNFDVLKSIYNNTVSMTSKEMYKWIEQDEELISEVGRLVKIVSA